MPAPDPADHRHHLATHIQNRRRALGLSIRAAADTAGISRITWTAAENGTRKTADNLYAGIERALHWQPGSIAATLTGGQPTELTPSEPPALSPQDEALVRVMRSPLSDEQKKKLIRMLLAEREAAERRRVEHADELIRLMSGEA